LGVAERRSLILYGKTGRGKTHLAVAIGYRAIQKGFETLFTTAAELIEDLSDTSKQGHLQESLATYPHPHVLVIDEVGYLTYGPDAANVLMCCREAVPEEQRGGKGENLRHQFNRLRQGQTTPQWEMSSKKFPSTARHGIFDCLQSEDRVR
jgi:hypothetical protein